MSGGDKIFKKRQARSIRSLKRKLAKRDSYDMVLIVCEGEKTEPNYFQALIDELQLNTANIQVINNTSGSSPRNVVDCAVSLYKKNKDYDRVYCIFDKDKHTNYLEAIDVVNRTKMAKGHSIHAITSVPCFEFWILLHFEYTTKSFDTKSGSICAQVITDLKKHLPNYEKGDQDTFGATKEHLMTAITRAKRVYDYCESGDTDMPSTKIHNLVEYLQNLKQDNE